MFRFLYKQLLLFLDADPTAKENCIFENSPENHQLQLKPKISLHLYTNQCPEGAAKDFYFKYNWLFISHFFDFNTTFPKLYLAWKDVTVISIKKKIQLKTFQIFRPDILE